MNDQDKSETTHRDNAEVIVDGVPKKVHAGSYVVSDFKRLVGVDAAKELEQVIEGKLVPLADGDTIVIKKGGNAS